jgi:hypothetical protein
MTEHQLWKDTPEKYKPTEPAIMPVAYDEGYGNALQNLAFALDANEISDRVFILMGYILQRNVYHYTSLTARRRCIKNYLQ